MTHIFSPHLLSKHKARLSRLQMPSSSETLHIIPEEEESCTSSSSRVSTPRTEYSLKPMFSTSYFAVSLVDLHLSKDDQSIGLSLRPLEVPPPSEGSRAASPTSSTSSSSSCSPLTPTSSDDEFSLSNNPRHVSVTRNKTFFVELDSDDDCDSEWYSEGFSKLAWPLPQPPPRPESLQLEPPIIRPLTPRKRAASRPQKHGRSVTKDSIPEIIEPLESPNPVIQPRLRSRSFRRPPPRTSMPVDCLSDDFIMGEDQSSDFRLFINKQPFPALISPAPCYASSYLTVPQFPDSPGSVYPPSSAHRHSRCADLEDYYGEIEFAVDDIQFDFSNDMPMRLPLSMPNTPNDLETDFMFGLDEL